MQELDKYGGVFECQRFRDIMMYSLSVFTFAVPQAVKVLADAIWRPQLKESEVSTFPHPFILTDSVGQLPVLLLIGQ